MKISIKWFTALFLFLGFTLSQTSKAQLSPVSFGVKAGLGLGKLSQEGIDSDFKLNYLAGISTDIGVGPLGVLADVIYGLRRYDAGSGGTYGMNRIEIPVQARFSMGLVRLQGGLYWAKVLGDLSSTDAAGTETTATLTQAALNSTDTGIVLGLGAKLPFVTLEARYMFGLSNISSAVATTTKTQSFDLVAGFWF
jgi:hypothetical protein